MRYKVPVNNRITRSVIFGFGRPGHDIFHDINAINYLAALRGWLLADGVMRFLSRINEI
jgi:hypothetical protein